MPLNVNNINLGFVSTVTAAGTLVLTKDSAYQQFFTGTNTHICTLPVATTLKVGQGFFFVNLSTGVVTVRTSGTNTVVAMAANTVLYVTCSNTAGGTGTASWTWEHFSANNTAISSGAVSSLTTIGTTGAATLSSGVLNIPIYAASGGAFAWTSTNGITAAGANQAAATLLTTVLNDVTTVTAGTGVRLPAATVNGYISIVNHGSLPLLVYPATGETVEGLAANAPLTLLEGQSYDAGCSVAGAWVGINVNVYDDENFSLNLPLHATQPPAPSTGVRIFTKNVGRQLAAAIGPSGIDYPFSPHRGKSRQVTWNPIGNATTVPVVDGILAPTILVTATTRNVATTNILTRMKRIGYVSAATANATTGIYFLAGAQQYTIGDGAGLGGFHSVFRFGTSDAAAVSGARAFIGWRSVVTAPTNVDPAAGTNQFGLAQISGDNTQWYIVYGGSAAQTAIALGTGLGAPTLTNTAFEVAFFAPPNSNNTVKYAVTNLGSGVTVTGTLTGTAGTALPLSTALLAPALWRTNNATALAVGIDISSIYIETDQ
jgi:hypothetical protein